MRSTFTAYDELCPIRKELCTVDAVSNGHLASLLGLDGGTVSRKVDDLVAAGLVRKVRDGKSVAISLPPGTHIYTHNYRTIGIGTADPSQKISAHAIATQFPSGAWTLAA